MSRVLLAFLLLGLSHSLLSQMPVDLDQGLRPYGSFGGGDVDSVSLSSGNLVLHIPLLSYSPRGKLTEDYFLVYNSELWHPKQLGNTTSYKYIWGPANGRSCTTAAAGVSVHSDGTATYSRFGPQHPGSAADVGAVRTDTDLPKVQFGSNGQPTDHRTPGRVQEEKSISEGQQAGLQ